MGTRNAQSSLLQKCNYRFTFSLDKCKQAYSLPIGPMRKLTDCTILLDMCPSGCMVKKGGCSPSPPFTECLVFYGSARHSSIGQSRHCDITTHTLYYVKYLSRELFYSIYFNSSIIFIFIQRKENVNTQNPNRTHLQLNDLNEIWLDTTTRLITIGQQGLQPAAGLQSSNCTDCVCFNRSKWSCPEVIHNGIERLVGSCTLNMITLYR